MCGIVALWAAEQALTHEQLQAQILAMRDTLPHRGPDSSGCWLDSQGQVALGHRRLSIIDLSTEGHQPMSSASGRYILSYNGEIYNYLQLRQELTDIGHHFRGNSDTEVLLTGIEEWGLAATLPRLNGMFALCLWDAQEKRMALARDRYGKKPLYYGKVGTSWVVASELKAIKALPEFSRQIDRQALGHYIQVGYVACPFSIYKDIKKLPPGSFCWLPGNPQAYWSLVTTAQTAKVSTPEQLEQALLQAVKMRMVSDVPLGAFLSGGIDSSLIVAMMQEQSSQPVRTFSIGFEADSHDEAVYAQRVALYLKTQHTQHYVSAQEALEVIPLLADMYDEPFADSSQIPTYLVSKFARDHVSVALSGDGGDEVFGGYNRYWTAPRLWNYLKRVPPSLRRFLALLLQRVPTNWLVPLLQGRVSYPQEKMQKLVNILPCNKPEALFQSLISQWQKPEQLLPDFSAEEFKFAHSGNFVEQMMVQDGLNYLPDDILVKVDRASMAVSLEVRAPLLDPVVSQLAWGLPLKEKIQAGTGKRILRQLLYKRVAAEFFQRPKAGFSIPLGAWLRGPLRPWAQARLESLKQENFIETKPVFKIWQEHLSGQRDFSAALWTVLMLKL